MEISDFEEERMTFWNKNSNIDPNDEYTGFEIRVALEELRKFTGSPILFLMLWLWEITWKEGEFF